MSRKYLLVIVGPTASGKTKLAIDIAKTYNTEIISADSRQIYKDLIIGTAQPTAEEQNLVKHHLINFVDIDKAYTVADYINDANRIINTLFETHNILILCGGTGLYVNAICYGIDNIPDISAKNRLFVRDLYKNKGLDYCVKELKNLDNTCDKYLDINNPHRVLRALEVILQTGKPIRTFYSNKEKKKSFDTIFININIEKDILNKRIELRVDEMIKNGLIEEVKKFYKYKNCNSMNTIGYKEIIDYLDNKITIEEAIAKIKINTIHYAKRQKTWFKKLKKNNQKNFIEYKNINV